MTKATITIEIELAPQDADLITAVPRIISERLAGTAVRVRRAEFTSVTPGAD